MDPRKKQYLHIALMAIAIICSVYSLEELFIVGATRWTTAFNALSLILVLLAFKTRPVHRS